MNKTDAQFMAQKIRTQYIEREASELDELRAIDKEVKRPINAFSYAFGSVGAIIMGAGMSLVMTDVGAKIAGVMGMGIGVGVGVVGIAMTLATYPIYKKLLASRKKKYSAQILELSDKIINK